jgi:hypothetical protein
MPSNKRRVNISIDTAVHDEMKKFLDMVGQDFSGFIEAMSVNFLGAMYPLVKRLEAAKKDNLELSPSELRVLFLQMMGTVNVEAGSQMSDILNELDILESEQANKAPPLDSKPPSPKVAIHTPKVTKTTKAKK